MRGMERGEEKGGRGTGIGRNGAGPPKADTIACRSASQRSTRGGVVHNCEVSLRNPPGPRRLVLSPLSDSQIVLLQHTHTDRYIHSLPHSRRLDFSCCCCRRWGVTIELICEKEDVLLFVGCRGLSSCLPSFLPSVFG